MNIWEQGQRAAYESLTPYEIGDLAFTIREATNSDIFNIFTIISAYLVVAYLAGAKLDRINVTIINLVYTVWMATFTFSMYQVALQLAVINSVRHLGVGDESAVLFTFIVVIGSAWVSSLIFMYRVSANSASNK